MKDEVAPTEETRPQMRAISSGLPDGGGVRCKGGRGGDNDETGTTAG